MCPIQNLNKMSPSLEGLDLTMAKMTRVLKLRSLPVHHPHQATDDDSAVTFLLQYNEMYTRKPKQI